MNVFESTRASAGNASRVALLLAVLLLPLALYAYAETRVDAQTRLLHLTGHEALIALATVLAGAATWLTLRAATANRSPYLEAAGLGLLGFTLVYVPHGLLTHRATSEPIFFLAFGPASRFVLAAYLLWAAFRLGAPAADVRASRWLPHVALFGLAASLVAYLATQPGLVQVTHLRGVEWATLALLAAGLGVALWRKRLGLPLAVATLVLAEASAFFLATKPWLPTWWLAHLTFGAGFLLMAALLVRRG